jgi:hypothetical protein
MVITSFNDEPKYCKEQLIVPYGRSLKPPAMSKTQLLDLDVKHVGVIRGLTRTTYHLLDESFSE